MHLGECVEQRPCGAWLELFMGWGVPTFQYLGDLTGRYGSLSEGQHDQVVYLFRCEYRVVIPIVKALERKEKAHALVGKAIADAYVEHRERLGYALNSHPRTEQESGMVFPVKHDVVEDSKTSYSHNITGCQFA